MAETMKRLEKKEKEGKEKKAKISVKAERAEKAKLKKWKGKDWFMIFSPRIFGANYIADTPAMDPKIVMGRKMEFDVSEIMRDRSKFYMKLRLKIDKITEKNAYTEFDGFYCARDYISRMIKKKSSKIMTNNVMKTKDGWDLRISIIAILLNKANVAVQKKVRENMVDLMKSNVGKSTIEDLLRSAIGGVVQRNIRKSSSTIYPIRFLEIEKIEVLGSKKE